MPVEHRFGPHSLRIEEDLVLIKFVGGATLEDFQRQMEIFAQIGDRMRQMVVLVDLSEAGLSEPRARKYAAEQGGKIPPLGLICFGANLLIRTGTLLIMRAARAIGKDVLNAQFVKTEAEARALAATYVQRSRQGS